MSKQQQLSPEKYITTKARSLPIYKCYLTSEWEESKITTAIVIRQHVNGKFTMGVYLVDLLCLGIKDTLYFFNITQDEFNERFDIDKMYLEEAEYNLVHNIIYAGHDFALDFGIQPHKLFSITKFILEEDDDNIPLIEIAVGDEDGAPHLVVDPSYNYAPVLQKLKQHAGEGNYAFTISDEDDFDDEEEDDDDDFDDDDSLEEIQEGFLDFHDITDVETEELETITAEGSRSISEGIVIEVELLLRQLSETEPDAITDFESLKETKDYALYDKKIEQFEESHSKNEDLLDLVFPEIRTLGMNSNNLDHETLMEEALNLLDKHKENDEISYMIVASIPLLTILSQLSKLESNFKQYLPAVQIFISTYAAIQHRESYPHYDFILNAATVEMAYPFNRHIHAMHYKFFWLLKAIHAIQLNDKEKIFYYHNLIRLVGTGGHIKFLYAAQLSSWLKEYMGIEEDEDMEEEDDEDYIDFEQS